MKSEQDTQTLSDMAKHEVAWKLMTELGISSIVVRFNGEGDTGDITDIEAYPAEPQPVLGYLATDAQKQAVAAWSAQALALNQAMRGMRTGIVDDPHPHYFAARTALQQAMQAMQAARTGIVDDPHPPVDPERVDDLTLEELIRALTYPITEGLEEDWVNNEGGFGSVTWHLEDQSILVEVSIRVVSTEDSSYEYDKYGQLAE